MNYGLLLFLLVLITLSACAQWWLWKIIKQENSRLNALETQHDARFDSLQIQQTTLQTALGEQTESLLRQHRMLVVAIEDLVGAEDEAELLAKVAAIKAAFQERGGRRKA